LKDALRRTELYASVETAQEDVVSQAKKIWELPLWEGLHLGNLSTEYKGKIHKMVVAIIPSLKLLAVHGKVNGQQDDSSIVLFTHMMIF